MMDEELLIKLRGFRATVPKAWMDDPADWFMSVVNDPASFDYSSDMQICDKPIIVEGKG